MDQIEFETVDEAYTEVLNLREALRKIVNMEPCLDGGSCFYPVHDGDGNYIGESPVDPVSVIQGMVNTAQEAIGNHL